MSTPYVVNTANARGVAMQRIRADDPTSYTTAKKKRMDAKFFAMTVGNELTSLNERQSIGKKVQIKNTTGGTLTAGTLVYVDTNKLTTQTSAVATNNPLAGTSVVINVAATFEVGQVVSINSGGNTDYAVVTAVSAGASVTVDILYYDQTTPTVTALPAYEVTKATATGVVPAEWVLSADVLNNAYGYAYDCIEVGNLNTVALTIENLLYLDTTAGGYVAVAPTGADVLQQVVGVVKKVNAATGIILFFPGNKRILKVGSSYFQTGAVSASASSGALADQVWRIPGAGGNAVFGAIDLTKSAAVSGILTSVNGGTGNGFTKFSGPAASEKTFTLPNATCTILTDNAAVTAAQGGTGNNNAVTSGFVFVADGAKYVGVAMSGDVTIASGGATTIGSHKITNAMIRQGGARTVVGVTGNSTADVADISLAADGKFLGSRASAIGAFFPTQILNKDVNYTLVQDDYGALVVCNTTAARVLTLPPPGTVGAGWWVAVKKTSSSTTFTQSIARNAAETIDGRSASDVLTSQYAYAIYMTDGTNWHVLAASDWLEAHQFTATNFPATGVYGDGASIVLTPGEWDISVTTDCILNGATCTNCVSGIGSTNGNSAAGLQYGDTAAMTTPPTAAADISISIPSWRTTTIQTWYCKVLATYSAGTPQYKCRISARRVR